MNDSGGCGGSSKGIPDPVRYDMAMAKASRNLKDDGLGGLAPRSKAAVRAPDEARLLRSCETLRRQIRPMTDPERAMHVATREVAELLSADDFCIATVTPGEALASLVTNSGVKDSWDRDLLARFARSDQREPPGLMALARIKRRGRAWGAVALRWDNANITWDIRNALTRYMRHANDVIADIERDRLLDVRGKIDRKIMEQLRSRDLFYQILDGLRSLTGYDHSATVLIGEGDQSAFEIAAEKLAWRHGKSQRVGAVTEVAPAELLSLQTAGVCGYVRREQRFVRWKTETPADEWLQQLLNQPCTRSPQEPPIGEALVAPLATRDGLRAALVVSAIHVGLLGEYEGELVSSFLPQVSISLQNSRWAEAMEAGMLETERKHAMADLARGVAHDVNNALGATIPLLQQVKHDLVEGRMDAATLSQDVEQIYRSVQVCRDIFGGMLRFAKTAARPQGTASVRAAVDSGHMILRAGLRRRSITVRIDIQDELPPLGLNQSELQQLLMNLMTNAVDAMETGGELAISACADGDSVRIEVRDSGLGIAPEILARIQDPFFTTKSQGSGLGLSICRSIVWRSHGDMKIESTVGQGTRVVLELPIAEQEAPEVCAPGAAETIPTAGLPGTELPGVEIVTTSTPETIVEEHAHSGD